MPGLSPEEYEEMRSLAQEPGLTEEERTRATAALASYEVQGSGDPLDDMEGQIASRLSPDFEPTVQALATMPATNRADGDQGAARDWVRSPESAKGTVFYYEPTLSSVQKRLYEDEGFRNALFPNVPLKPEEIAALTKDSSEVQAAQDKMWQETADAASAAGKTAYRYSKAPWLHGGGAMSGIKTLGMKALSSVPVALEGITSFVGGVDSIGSFGIGKAMSDADPTAQGGGTPGPVGRAVGDPNASEGAGGNEFVGLGPGGLEQAAERNPKLNVAGGVVGALHPKTMGARLFGILGKAGQSAIGPGAGLAARTATAAATGTVGMAADQVAREGVNAASNLAQTGQTGSTLGESASRVGGAALNPLAPLAGAGGEIVGTALQAAGKAVAGRYSGNIERLEGMGGSVKPLSGPAGNAGAESAIARGKKLDASPVDPIAMETAPAINANVKETRQALNREIGATKEAFYPTREGQILVPAKNMQQEALAQLDEMHSETRGALRPVGAYKDAAREVKDLFNKNIETVSLKPVEGAIEMTPEQAQSYLAPVFKSKLLPKSPKKPPPEGGTREVDLGGDVREPPAGGAAGDVLETYSGGAPGDVVVPPVNAREAGTVPPPGKAKKPDGVVQGKADRDVTPTTKIKDEFGEARNEYGEAMAPYREAQQADNARAAKLKDGPGMDPDRPLSPPSVPEGREGAAKTEKLAGEKPVPGKAPPSAAGVPGAPRSMKEAEEELNRLYGNSWTEEGQHARSKRLGLAPGSEAKPASVPEWKEGAGKAYIDDLWKAAKDKFKSREEFNEALLKAHRGTKGGVLDRLDLVAAADAGKLKASTVKAGNAEYDLVSTKEAGRLLKEWGIVGAGATLAATQDDEQGEGAAAAGAGVLLAKTLRRRGIDKVYVVPRRYNAKNQDAMLQSLQDVIKQQSSPHQRQAAKIYATALQDRDLRPMNGEPGGWSAQQRKHFEMLEAADREAELVAPGGDSFQSLVGYGKQAPGQLPRMQALQTVAGRAGVSDRLNEIRMLDPLLQLRGQTTLDAPTSKSAYGAIRAAGDATMLRLGYPGMKALGDPGSSLRGGSMGRSGLLKRDEKEKR